MTEAIIILTSIGILLFTLSFFMSNKFKVMEEQIEQLSLSTMQESYQLKKKIKILEEELLTDDVMETDFTKTTVQTPLLRKIIHLSQSGASIQTIANETNLSEYDIRSVLNQFNKES
ncbi:hypothetical protein [Aquibacillus salsiterrae]|uniref:DUF2802 domain-containing protein n=1 Tax=Aquibacillus salsiterrae TaxID=2950439 RepID=A0A9X4AEZ6_9BACI|nr:hypothetical protein [Aquibacillus salsiterrae]MDC3415523.1 hypothetical protein [Aquibacillus salsiterrae]